MQSWLQALTLKHGNVFWSNDPFVESKSENILVSNLRLKNINMTITAS